MVLSFESGSLPLLADLAAHPGHLRNQIMEAYYLLPMNSKDMEQSLHHPQYQVCSHTTETCLLFYPLASFYRYFGLSFDYLLENQPEFDLFLHDLTQQVPLLILIIFHRASCLFFPRSYRLQDPYFSYQHLNLQLYIFQIIQRNFIQIDSQDPSLLQNQAHLS